MKKFFKLFGCTRARTKQLSSVELLKDNDMNSQNFDKSFHDKNKNNCFHIKIKSENIYTIPEMSIDNKDIFIQFQKLVLIIKIIIKIYMDLI